jgi:class 3 adenylate cyclase
MNIPETRYARTTDGMHIAYQVVGEGADFVYVAGWFSNVDLIWEQQDIAPFLRRLARSGRLIVFDRRGTGLSDDVAESPQLETMMDDIQTTMDAAGSDRAFLIGVTMGAALACLFAATYPERTLGLALIHGQARSARAPDYPWGETPEFHQEETERMDEGWGVGAFERWFVHGTPHADDEAFIARTAKYLRHSMTPRAAVIQNQMWIETDVRDILPAVHVPALVFEGDRSAEATKDLADRLPLAEIVRLPGQSRLPWVPGNEVAAESIQAFARTLLANELELDRTLATVMFTDIVGSTALAAALGDRAWRERRDVHDRAVRANIARYRGQEVKTLGDGFLVTFDGPARAVRCALAIMSAVGQQGIEVRAGLHTGEVEIDREDVSGIAVAIAARVGELARPNEVLVSRTVKDLVAGSSLTFEDGGEHELKGVPDRWRLYRVVRV